MNPRIKKIILLTLAVALLVGVSQVQRALNHDRETLGLTRVTPLENAPPVLAFTTVALGGFRGLIANALWIRASELQENDKFFEMQQLADWVTKLEPHFSQVWVHQAWNMAYNISVKFKENAPGVYTDRWRWVRAGIELLRDQGLRYNPNDILIHRELSWFFQHKMGANLDDANMYYKQEWADEMADVFGGRRPNLEELINPTTDEARERGLLLTNKYKMSATFMKEVDELYGPLEWRLPEAHAIYWAAQGLERARENPTKVKAEDMMQLRRSIYQSMQQAFLRGRLVENPFNQSFEFGPNLDIIPKVNAAYELQQQEADPKDREHIGRGQRNFLRYAIYFLFVHNRLPEAAQWFQYLGANYPDRPLLDGDPNSLPHLMTLDEYCVARVIEDVHDTSQVNVRSAIEGLLVNAFTSLVLGEDDQAAGYERLAKAVYDLYQSKIAGSEMRIGLPPFDDIKREVLLRLLDPEHGFSPEVRRALRLRLGLPPEETAPSLTPSASGTNAPATERR